MNEELLLHLLGRGHAKFEVLFAHPRPPSQVDPAVLHELEQRLEAFLELVVKRAVCFAAHRNPSAAATKKVELTAQDVTMAWKSIEMSFH